MDGALVLDKPEGWTSHDADNKIRRLAGTRKVGHLGTLDPIATGVLPLLIGRATRLSQFYVRSEKFYEAVVRFGFSTDTYDRAGAPTSPVTEMRLTREDVEPLLSRFRGSFQQVPPPVSAKKIGGVPAYKLARKHVEVNLAPVEIEVYDLELLEVTESEIKLRVRCSAGTYMRAIAHELGLAIGCGAHLQDLRRLASGHFCLEQARTVQDLQNLAATNHFEEAIIPVAELLPDFPAAVLESFTVGQVRQGRDFHVSPFRAQAGTRYVKAVSPEGELVAIGEAKLPHVFHPVVVL